MRAKIFRGTVLLVTGDDRLRNELERALLQGGFGVRLAKNQDDALVELRSTTPAILIVDRRESGFSRLRQDVPDLPPIVTITYHVEPCDDRHCVTDLEDGATRAVCNASPAIIVALLGAVLRRQRWDRPAPTHYVADALTVNLEKYEVTVGSMPVHVSRTEFRILESLVAAPGHYLSRRALQDQVWGEGFAIYPHTLNVHISSLRRKLDPVGANPGLITTVKGLGFKLRGTAAADDRPVAAACRSAASDIRPVLFRARRKPAPVSAVPAGRRTSWRRFPDRTPELPYPMNSAVEESS